MTTQSHTSSPLIVDGHEPLAWNALTFGRKYPYQSTKELWESEAGTSVVEHNDFSLLGHEAWQKGRVALVFGTLFVSEHSRRRHPWEVTVYRTPEEAYTQALKQLDVYLRWHDETETLRVVRSKDELEGVLDSWDQPTKKTGIIPLMKGCDPVREPEQVEEWIERGVRLFALSWEKTRYAGSVYRPDDISPEGQQLLEILAEHDCILDVNGLSSEGMRTALDRYDAQLIASSMLLKRFSRHDAGLSDQQIEMISEREGLIGLTPFNGALKKNWSFGDRKEDVGLHLFADAIDHVCQVTGSADFVGIGTNFDGGFGYHSVPREIESVADLQKLTPFLREKGFDDDQVEKIFSGNWLRILETSLP